MITRKDIRNLTADELLRLRQAFAGLEADGGSRSFGDFVDPDRIPIGGFSVERRRVP